MELDHLFIAAPVTAVPAHRKVDPDWLGTAGTAQCWRDALVSLGFDEGSSNRHPGQGTANHRFFFQNFMLEFLYVDDVEGLGNARTRLLQLAERFCGAGSPLGLASRRTHAEEHDAAYAYVCYRPHYLPESISIQVASGVPVREPLWFHLPFVAGSGERGEPMGSHPVTHANGVRSLTALHWEVVGPISAQSRRIASLLGIEVMAGVRDRVHLVFDDGQRGRVPLPDDMNLSITT